MASITFAFDFFGIELVLFSTHITCFPLYFCLISCAVLNVNRGIENPVEPPKKLYLSPPSASRVQLLDGRHMAYQEKGVPAERARFSLIAPHSFLSSRLAGRVYYLGYYATYTRIDLCLLNRIPSLTLFWYFLV